MKRQFEVVSDGSCDLPGKMSEEMGISVVHFLVSFDGREYKKEGEEIELKDFYERMAKEPGNYPMTAAPSPEDFFLAFEPFAKEGKNIICVCISTKLSSSAQSALIAREMAREKYPDVRIEVVDSLCATLMQSVYVQELCRLRDGGADVESALAKMGEIGKTARILFTVGNLDYIQHGGRIGKMTGMAATLLDLKPLITLQDGEIHSSGIRRGRKKSIDGVIDLLCSYLKEQNCSPIQCNIAAGYGWNYEEGLLFQQKTVSRLEALYKTRVEIPLYQIGATIGVHAGPTSLGFGVIHKSM